MKEESLQKRWMRRVPIYHHTSPQIHRQKGVLYTVHTAQLGEIYAWAPAHSFSSRTCSYKTDDEPLLNLTGAMSHCSREGIMCTQKRELESSPLSTANTGPGV